MTRITHLLAVGHPMFPKTWPRPNLKFFQGSSEDRKEVYAGLGYDEAAVPQSFMDILRGVTC